MIDKVPGSPLSSDTVGQPNRIAMETDQTQRLPLTRYRGDNRSAGRLKSAANNETQLSCNLLHNRTAAKMRSTAVRCACVVPPYINAMPFLRVLTGVIGAICISLLTSMAQGSAMRKIRLCDSLFLGGCAASNTRSRNYAPHSFLYFSRGFSPAPGRPEPAGGFALPGNFQIV